MVQTSRRSRPRYASPRIVPLGEVAVGVGVCNNGSRVVALATTPQNCNAGSANAGNCLAGTYAGGNCNGGTNPSMPNNCTNGAVARQ
jgi:hypothetical protein